MSDGSLKDLYIACDGEFDIPFGDIDKFDRSYIIREAYAASLEIGNMLYLYRKDGKYRLTTHVPEGWKINGVSRIYPGGRIELRKEDNHA